jgi:hypothetical protein
MGFVDRACSEIQKYQHGCGSASLPRSISPASSARVRYLLRLSRYSDLERFAGEVLALDSPREIERHVAGPA